MIGGMDHRNWLLNDKNGVRSLSLSPTLVIWHTQANSRHMLTSEALPLLKKDPHI